MSILSKNAIKQAIEDGKIIADGVNPEQIKDQSIDCSLHAVAWKYNNSTQSFQKIFLFEPYLFRPGDFVLGIIDEWIGTTAGSNLCCEWRLKSTAARHGLDNALAMWIEQGYYSRLCTEFYFHKPLELQAGMLIGQFIFHTLEGAENEDYVGKGTYQKTSNILELKANWKAEDVLPGKLKLKK